MAPPTSIRFDQQLPEQVATLAQADRRTFSGELQYLVEQALRLRDLLGRREVAGHGCHRRPTDWAS